MTTTCAALTHRRRLRPAGYGSERIPCRVTRGLRSFMDRDGITRWYCPAEGHRQDVERRFGLADPPEPEWRMPESADPVTAAKAETERRVAPETESELAGAWGR